MQFWPFYSFHFRWFDLWLYWTYGRRFIKNESSEDGSPRYSSVRSCIFLRQSSSGFTNVLLVSWYSVAWLAASSLFWQAWQWLQFLSSLQYLTGRPCGSLFPAGGEVGRSSGDSRLRNRDHLKQGRSRPALHNTKYTSSWFASIQWLKFSKMAYSGPVIDVRVGYMIPLTGLDPQGQM